MRTTSYIAAAFVAAALLTSACRDEQAGPRHRPLPQTAASSTGRTLQSAPSDLTFRSTGTWADGAIRYLGSKVEPAHPQPGQAVRLTHYFQAVKTPPSGWSLFTHVIDPGTGAMLVNADHPIQGGAMPLDRWPVGAVIEDAHQISAPSGGGRVVLGFWRDDARLPVDQAQAHDGTHRMLGPKLGGSSDEPLPEYQAKRTASAPRLDGDLSDEVWKNAPEIVLVGSMRGEPVRLRTTARILYDEQHLYVGFDAEDPDVWGTLLNRDDPIYGQEVVEVFLDANADGRTYNELQVSPNNTLFDAYFPARRQGMDLSWDSKMQTAVKIRGTLNDPSDLDEGWSAEMKIPFGELAEVPRLPKSGDRWRMNLYRLDLPDRRRQEGQSFSPVQVPDFHNLSRFGWLVFE
ncbi:MAG: carbohydrate-binding family 9-like protein [Myxococcaceae bacterium]